jgi:hypothetical protein
MTHVPAAIKAEVEQRAGGRCEYCRLSQAGQEARFHIDHILPVRLGGKATIQSLCLSVRRSRRLAPGGLDEG